MLTFSRRSFKGTGALAFLSYLLPASLATLPVPGEDAHRPFGSTLSVLLNEQGGILDDCMITRWGEERCVACAFSPVAASRSPPHACTSGSFYLVTNAGRSDVDIPWIQQHVERWNGEHAEKVEFSVLDSSALIALQGTPIVSGG